MQSTQHLNRACCKLDSTTFLCNMRQGVPESAAQAFFQRDQSCLRSRSEVFVEFRLPSELAARGRRLKVGRLLPVISEGLYHGRYLRGLSMFASQTLRNFANFALLCSKVVLNITPFEPQTSYSSGLTTKSAHIFVSNSRHLSRRLGKLWALTTAPGRSGI